MNINLIVQSVQIYLVKFHMVVILFQSFYNIIIEYIFIWNIIDSIIINNIPSNQIVVLKLKRKIDYGYWTNNSYIKNK